MSGSLGMLGSRYVLSLTRQDARSGAVVRRASAQFPKLENIGKQIKPTGLSTVWHPLDGHGGRLEEELETAAEQPAPEPRARRQRAKPEEGSNVSMWRALISPAAAVLPCLLVAPALLTGCGGVCDAGNVMAQGSRYTDQLFPSCGLGCTCCTMGCASTATTLGLFAAGGAAAFGPMARRFAVAIMLSVWPPGSFALERSSPSAVSSLVASLRSASPRRPPGRWG